MPLQSAASDAPSTGVGERMRGASPMGFGTRHGGTRPSWRSEAKVYAQSAGAGLAIGLAIVAVLAVVTILVPMGLRRSLMGVGEGVSSLLATTSSRRAATSSPLASSLPAAVPSVPSPDAPVGDPAGGAGANPASDGRDLPQVDWGMALTDEERSNMEALRQDVRGMADTSAINVLSWPVLPYPVLGEDGWDGCYDCFERILDGVYNGEPELSVYTNGQNSRICVVIAKYHLGDAEGASREENLSEYRAVVRAADALDAEIGEMMADPATRRDVDAGLCSEDELYVMLLYRALGSRATYSDGIDDTAHENDIYGALVEGESKCYGMACATKALLNRRGVPSIMSSGSVGGDEERRHAWVTAWLGGRWRVIDLTYAQGLPAPDAVDVEAGTSGRVGFGYWGGCLVPYDEYVESRDMVVDEVCSDVMVAYERRVASVE